MIDVTSTNFETLLPEIEESIKNASFIAIDTEFTGLVSSDDKKPSLFDTGEQRYSKLRENASKYTICQLGLAMFTNDKVANRYLCRSYNFYLHPPAFGSIDNIFSFQPSSLEFLNYHGFDFNKFLVYGIPHLNDEEEKTVVDEIKQKTFLLTVERDTCRHELQTLCSAVSEWISSADENELRLEKVAGIRDYVQVNELRHRFSSISASVNADNKIVVRRISDEERIKLEQQSVSEDEKIVSSLLGFTRVFRLLVEAKKTIVGHNMFMDLLYMYQKFYKPLPKSYKTFKLEICQLFPEVFDTKHISSNIRKKLEKVRIVEMSSLQDIYRSFLKITFSVLYVPHVIVAGHAVNDTGPEIKSHEAGFDAYATGYIFLRMAHILAMENVSTHEGRPLSWTEHRRAVMAFANQVNLIRAMNHNLNLSGPDPQSERPQWLVVTTKNNYRCSPAQVVEMLSRFGCVDAKPLFKNQILVAVSTYGCARDILRAFANDDAIEVSPYNLLRYSRPLRLFLWSSWLLSSSFSAYFIYKLVKSSLR